MDEQRKREVYRELYKRRRICKYYQILLVDIVNKLGDGPISDATLEESYNLYLDEITAYPGLFQRSIADIIIEKAKLNAKEIIMCYLDEAEETVDIYDGRYRSLVYKLWKNISLQVKRGYRHE